MFVYVELIKAAIVSSTINHPRVNYISTGGKYVESCSRQKYDSINSVDPTMCLLRTSALQWRHNGHNGVSNHQPHHCLLSR